MTAISCACSEQFLLKHLIRWKRKPSQGKPYTWSRTKILHPSSSDVWTVSFSWDQSTIHSTEQKAQFGGKSTSEGPALLANISGELLLIPGSLH